MIVWDYKLPKNWKPRDDFEWSWYLIRRINYGDFKGLKKEIVKKYYPKIKKHLSKGKRLLLETFLKYERKNFK